MNNSLNEIGKIEMPEPVCMYEKLSEESKVEEVKIMKQDLKQEFPETYNEEEEREEREWKEKMGDNMQYVIKLENSPYSFNKEGFKSVDNGFGYSRILSNVLIVPLKKINICDGEDKRSFIELKAILNNGEELPTICIPIKQIDSNNFYTNSEWGIRIIFISTKYKEEQRQCIKFLARDIAEETIFGFTGLYTINGKPIFLHSGGAIGTEKIVKVELEDEVLNRFCFDNKEFNVVDTTKITLSCLNTASMTISLPMLSLNFLAPLTSTFERIGIPVGFLTWVQGIPQCKKTSLTSAINSHFRVF